VIVGFDRGNLCFIALCKLDFNKQMNEAVEATIFIHMLWTMDIDAITKVIYYAECIF